MVKETCVGCGEEGELDELVGFQANGVPPGYYCSRWCAEDVTGAFADQEFMDALSSRDERGGS